MPHHCAYRRGWRGTNWNTFEQSLSPTAEIFSEHGNSLEPESHFGMYRHSMGGSSRSQAVMEQLKRGRILGFTEGTDDHFGYPGCYVEDLTRDAVTQAIRRRHTYGVTGDRVGLTFSSGDAMMGDVLSSSAERGFEVDVRGMDELDYVELVKNGQSVIKWTPEVEKKGSLKVVRIEWGWDGMLSQDITRWCISIKAENCELLEGVPCFCGGPHVIEQENTLRRIEGSGIETESHTCRSNFNPKQPCD